VLPLKEGQFGVTRLRKREKGLLTVTLRTHLGRQNDVTNQELERQLRMGITCQAMGYPTERGPISVFAKTNEPHFAIGRKF